MSKSFPEPSESKEKRGMKSTRERLYPYFEDPEKAKKQLEEATKKIESLLVLSFGDNVDSFLNPDGEIWMILARDFLPKPYHTTYSDHKNKSSTDQEKIDKKILLLNLFRSAFIRSKNLSVLNNIEKLVNKLEEIQEKNNFEENYKNTQELLREIIRNKAVSETNEDFSKFGSIPEDFANEQLLKEVMEEVISTLKTRERRILELRFGLTGDFPMNFLEIGEIIGITRERVRQIESKVLRELRLPRNRRPLIDFL